MIKVNGEDFPWEEGLTVKKLLEKKGYTFPTIVVLINGLSVPENEYVSTIIPDGADVKAIHLVAGG
ncbi:MAG: thiamine biosynthesis protein ThiS [Peptococcaceae bacterium]|jgi:sulfur carrier protein|nr:thiamine biosynthesis protein ThiS [Peptococcaceae bacterium]